MFGMAHFVLLGKHMNTLPEIKSIVIGGFSERACSGLPCKNSIAKPIALHIFNFAIFRILLYSVCVFRGPCLAVFVLTCFESLGSVKMGSVLFVFYFPGNSFC